MPFIHVNESSMTFFPIEGDPEIIPVPEEYLYLGEIEDMNNAILDGAENYISLKETRDHIRTIRALYKSAKERSVVSLD
jgi:predicted dehydrogenase